MQSSINSDYCWESIIIALIDLKIFLNFVDSEEIDFLGFSGLETWGQHIVWETYHSLPVYIRLILFSKKNIQSKYFIMKFCLEHCRV